MNPSAPLGRRTRTPVQFAILTLLAGMQPAFAQSTTPADAPVVAQAAETSGQSSGQPTSNSVAPEIQRQVAAQNKTPVALQKSSRHDDNAQRRRKIGPGR